jgi:hypothetical protein
MVANATLTAFLVRPGKPCASGDMSRPAKVPELPQALKLLFPTAGRFARIAPSTLSKAASASNG